VTCANQGTPGRDGLDGAPEAQIPIQKQQIQGKADEKRMDGGDAGQPDALAGRKRR
jgi:hypothetical protein